MSLPVAHGLLGATVVAASIRGVSLKRDWRVLSMGAALAIVPDFDYFFYILLGLGEGWHRTFTHSILFALVTGVLAGALFHTRRLRMALVYFLATVSHPILDVFTSRNAGGVELFWPFYTARIRFGLVDYYKIFTEAPRPLSEIVLQVLKTSALELIVFGCLFLASLWLNRVITASRE